MSNKTPFLTPFQNDLNLLAKGFAADSIAMMQASDVHTGHPVAVIGIVKEPTAENPTYDFYPIARMLTSEDVRNLKPPGDGVLMDGESSPR